jgi:hypothetical protein
MAFGTFCVAMIPLSYDYETFGPIDTFLRDRGLINTAESVVNAATFTSVFFAMYSFRRAVDIPEALLNSWKLLFRLIVADLVINLPFIILNFSLIYTDRPNPLLFSISMPLLQAQGIAIYCTYTLNQAALQRMCFFCWVDPSLRASVIFGDSSSSGSSSKNSVFSKRNSYGLKETGAETRRSTLYLTSKSYRRVSEEGSDPLLQSLIRSFEFDDRIPNNIIEEDRSTNEVALFDSGLSTEVGKPNRCKISASQIEFGEQIGLGSFASVTR